MSDKPFDIPHKSDIIPEVMENHTKMKFRCHKGISCFNACCKHADITLTPYDILRLKDNKGVSTTEFLAENTVPFEMDRDATPGVKLRTQDEGACIFMTEEGCSVYEDRPTVCRYYPVAHLAMHIKGTDTDEAHYSMVKESHCRGHDEDRSLTIGDYRIEQGVDDYDLNNRGWLQLILKKRSAGPSIGRPSEMSLQLFFMANYDLDRFRKFVDSPSFKKTYQVSGETHAAIQKDDLAALEFGNLFLKQILYGEKTIEEFEGAYEKRLEERAEIAELRREYELAKLREKEEAERREVTELD